MAYFDNDGDTVTGAIVSNATPTTLMVTDIAAIQYLYGANEQYNAGDTTYTLGSFSDKNYIYASIQDAGGIDPFSWADQTTSAIIDLLPGKYSFFGKIGSQSDPDLESDFGAGDGILGIAENCVIENAIGGSNRDLIQGNSAANILYGGTGAGTSDMLWGKGGNDIFVCSLSDATTNFLLSDIVLGFTNGEDKIGLEDRVFADLTISNNSGHTRIVDTGSNKILFTLDSFDHTLMDITDFIVTDFV